jgi:DNA-binding beta-propeller fold protein YncE
LTSIGAATAVTGAAFVDNAIVDPTGKYLYVVDGGTPTGPGQIYGYNLGAGGSIGTPITGTPLPTGVSPGGIAIDPTGKLIAVDYQTAGDPGGISLYAVGTGGSLTADLPVTVENSPFGIVFYIAP